MAHKQKQVFGSVAQRVEQLAVNQPDAGANPVGASIAR